MKPLPTSALTHVVEHLPTPIVVLDDGGFVVSASPCAVDLLALRIDDNTHLERHLAGTDGAHSVGRRSLIPTDSGTHELVAIVGAPVPLPPKDVAALAGAVAHDFNNLLGVIMNFTTLAAATLPPGSPAASDLREVLAASQRAATIAQRLQELGEVRPAGRFAEPC